MTEDIQPEQHHKTLEISNASVMQANNKGRNNERDQACERGSRSRSRQAGRCQPESHAADGQDSRKALQADVFVRGDYSTEMIAWPKGNKKNKDCVY